MRTAILVTLTTIGSVGCSRIESGKPVPVPESSAPAPNNTAVNKRDADLATKLPTDQGENPADRERTAEIRKKILDTKDLSVNARNIKVITADGKVTLRGPVDSDAEREVIAKLAAEIAGESNVDNQLEVVSDRK